MFYRPIWLAGGWLIILLITYLSLTHSPPAPLRFEHADKLEHMAAYTLLMGWFCQLYFARKQRIWLAFAFIAFGGIIELLQGWSGYRTADWLDLLSDSLGVGLGWLLSITSLQYFLTRLDARLAPHHDR